MAVNVVKIPVPNSQVCIIRIGAQVLDILEYRVMVRPKNQRIEIQGMPNQLIANHFIWALVEYGNVDKDGVSEFVEDHQFVIVETEALIPEVPFQLNYIGLGVLPLADNSLKEFHCFWGGRTMDYVGKDLPNLKNIPKAEGSA